MAGPMRRLRGGHVTSDPRLDRVPHFDPRSRAFPAVVGLGDKRPRSYSWAIGVTLDQGMEGACAGFAVAHEAAARPAPVPGVTEDVARGVYHRARELDEWPGEDYEGTSVLAAVKAGAERGWYVEYRWAFGEEDLALALGYHGPAILGIRWYEGMHNPDASGLIRPTGALSGGHAILCRGISLRHDVYRLHNSWGELWGVERGDCFISRADMARLLHEDGEACIPVVRKLGSG